MVDEGKRFGIQQAEKPLKGDCGLDPIRDYVVKKLIYIVRIGLAISFFGLKELGRYC